MKRRDLLIGGAAAAMLPALARAQAGWPSRTVRVVIAYPPGGSTDTAGRLLAEKLTARLGQQVIVDNRAGAGGTVGASHVVRAEPDGYTLLLAASPEVSIAPIIMKGLSYDPVKELQPIALVGQVPFFLVVNPGLPVQSLKEFLDYARKNPGKLNYSSFGNNTSNHLAGEHFKALAGIDATHVPYKGSGPSITDLIGGQVQYTLDTPPAVLGHVKSGKLRALAVATGKRLESAPDVPTFDEAGLPGFTAGTWFGLLAPAGTPAEVIARVNKETVAALSAPDLAKEFANRGIVPGGGDPQSFGRFIASEVDKWRSLAAKVGIEPQ
jgi:tripartite-type tricarboxylate transporter receptor subunit TctC